MKKEKEKEKMYIPTDPVLVQEREQSRILTRKLNETLKVKLE